MSKKKTKNPFKMWGSYVGMVIGILEVTFGTIQKTLHIGFPTFGLRDLFMCTSSGFNKLCFFAVYNPTLYWGSLYIIYGILGFLLGWGITLLWRKFKK